MEGIESGKAAFVKKSKNQIEKKSKNTKNDVSEITGYNCLVKGHCAKDCKDPKQLKLGNGKKDEKKLTKKDSKIKTDFAASVTESKPVMLVNY